MANINIIDLGKDAFENRNYLLATEIFERCLYECNGNGTLELYRLYGDSLARSSRIKESFDVYSHICNLLNYHLPLDQLKNISYSLIESILIASRRNSFNNGNNFIGIGGLVCGAGGGAGVGVLAGNGPNNNNLNTNSNNNNNNNSININNTGSVFGSGTGINNNSVNCVIDNNNINIINITQQKIDFIDPFCCFICRDILKYPVTTICGHTFCRTCCRDKLQCPICGYKFQSYTNQNLEQDILVRRLVERWWEPELKASDINDEIIQLLENNLIDDALRCCNESLEKAPNNFNGLLLRSEVLYRLNHFQRSLADADNALKCRSTSYKAHFRRAEALASLDRIEESLIAHCVSICLDKTAQSISTATRHDVTRLIQRLLVPSNSHSISSIMSAPYIVMSARRRRQSHHHNHNHHYNNHNHYHNNNNNNININNNHHIHRNHHLQNDHRLLSVNCSTIGSSDYEEDNSSCGEDDNNFITHHRRSRRFNSSQQNVIPRPNTRLRSLLDRIYQEIEKIRRIESPLNLQVNPSLIESSDFDCVLCCRTLWRPVVTPCGHTYCWICLDRSMDYSSLCPLCKSPLIEPNQRHSITNSNNNNNNMLNINSNNNNNNSNNNRITNQTLISLSKLNVTYFIEEAMKRFIPGIYLKRQSQEMELEPSVPIFICTTAFPSVPCPLLVYEPRYRLMVRRAIESGKRQFGIVLPQNERFRYHDYGTMLDIKDCVMLQDGHSILSTIGSRRFRVLARGEKDGYDTAKIEYIKDELIKNERLSYVREFHKNVLLRATIWYKSLKESFKIEIAKSFGSMPELEDDWEISIDGPAWVWWITAILPLKQSLQTEMLGTTSLEKRLLVINKTLLAFEAAQQPKIEKAKTKTTEDSCEGFPICQAADCCQRGSSSTRSSLDERTNTNQTTEFLL